MTHKTCLLSCKIVRLLNNFWLEKNLAPSMCVCVYCDSSKSTLSNAHRKSYTRLMETVAYVLAEGTCTEREKERRQWKSEAVSSNRHIVDRFSKIKLNVREIGAATGEAAVEWNDTRKIGKYERMRARVCGCWLSPKRALYSSYGNVNRFWKILCRLSTSLHAMLQEYTENGGEREKFSITDDQRRASFFRSLVPEIRLQAVDEISAFL